MASDPPDQFLAMWQNAQRAVHEVNEQLYNEQMAPIRRKQFRQHVIMETCVSVVAIFCILVYCHIIP